MRKTITINGTEYKFKSSAAIPRIYRLKFGRDIFVDMQKIEKQIKIQEKLKDEMQKKCAKEGTEFDESKFESGIPIESLEMFENIAFLMHKHGCDVKSLNLIVWRTIRPNQPFRWLKSSP